jgi:cytochrome d ubiquinol oxidase subunit II
METFLGIDYPTLWFLVVGGVFTGYAILDGFDLGAGALHLFFRKEKSRRIALNAIGPVWDGNEVWLVIGGGTLFAGFPIIYANMFSAFYIPFMLFLVMLIFRAIGIEVRSKEEGKTWRKFWDVAYSLSSVLIAFLLGVVVGNIIVGIPLDEQHLFRGSWLEFLNPYSLMVGVTTVALFMMHGAIYLTMKTEDRLYDRLTVFVKNSTIFFVMSLIIVTIYTLLYIPHMTDKLSANPEMFAIPLIMMLAVANITRQISKRKYLFAFLSSAVVISMLLVIVALELYPTVIYASNDPQNSLTVYNSASSDKSLGIMLTFAAIGVPLVASYTIFVFYTFRGKVELDETSY